ncbi:MAG TPA: DUF4412 domain-containing protein [Flavobacteriales bacterium]|nr:DUF4412 domain-containing protein [Flavobacteriales bacterium]
MNMRLINVLVAITALILLSAGSPVADPKAFTGSFRMEVHTFKNNKEDKHSPVNMRIWSREDMMLYELVMPGQQQQMRMLSDLRGNWSYTLIDNGQGSRTAMKMKRPEFSGLVDDKKGEKPQITVTKETKVIEGHNCIKVIATSKEGTWTAWVATGLRSAFLDMARAMDGQAAQQNRFARTDVEGFPLEYEWAPASGDERVVCNIKELVVGKVDDKLFDLSGYQLIEMPSFGMPPR